MTAEKPVQQDHHENQTTDGTEAPHIDQTEKPANKKSPFGPGINFGPGAFGKHGNAWIGGSKATFNKQRPGRAAARGR